MHPFYKLQKQIVEGEVLHGAAIYHIQPKDHKTSECTATVIVRDKNSLKLRLKYEKHEDKFPYEIMIRKANVSEYGNEFRILYDEDNALVLFVVGKMYI